MQNQILFKDQLTMKRDNIKLSFHAQKMFHLINSNKIDSFKKKEIKQYFLNNLSFFKTIDFGIGCHCKSFSLEMYRLMMSFQESRMKKIRDRKVAFIQNVLKKDLEISDNLFNDLEYFNFLYDFAKIEFKKWNKQDIIFFIKKTLKKEKLNIDFQKLSLIYRHYMENNFQDKNTPKLHFDEIIKKNYNLYLTWRLENDERFLKKVYLFCCESLNVKNKELHLKIERKVDDIRKNILISKKNANYKCIYNFSDENMASWLTLTLAHHNKDKTLSKDVKDLIKTKKLVKLFIIELKKQYSIILKKENKTQEEIKNILKKIKYSIAAQLQKMGVWHFHILFNIDLLKIFGYTNKYIFRTKPNGSEIFESYAHYQKERRDNGWYIAQEKGVIVPHVFKIWSDIVKKYLPNLKKISPCAQNLQLFYKKNERTQKIEINECKIKKSKIINKYFSVFISQYVTKYDTGLSKKEIQKMIKNKEYHLTGKNLFQFSRSCIPCPISKTLKYLPFDLDHSKYILACFFTSNILDFKKDSKIHPLQQIAQNSILRANNKKIIMYNNFLDNSELIKDFENNKDQYLLKYIFKKGKLVLRYNVFIYSNQLFKNQLGSKSYKKTCENLNYYFNLGKLKTKITPKNNLEKQKLFFQFKNYINPFYDFSA